MSTPLQKKSVLLAIVLFSILSTVARAQDASRQTDDFIRKEMQERHIPGISLAVLKDGKMLKESAYGLASVELNVPATVNTVYPIASATKPFTSTAIMTLVDEGKLKLDDTVGALLPNPPASWSPVTVKQLLTHTSGLPDVAVRPGREELIADNQEEAFRKLAEMPLAFKPGERWAHNQTNYILLGMIFEKLAGISVENYIQQNFFQKLGMTASTYGDATDVVPGRASTYRSTRTEN